MYKEKSDLRAMYRRKYQKDRLRVLEILGGRCVKCGTDDLEVLQIDHIIPIKRKAGERLVNCKLFRKIIRSEYPTDNLQLLCANDHMKKSRSEFVIK